MIWDKRHPRIDEILDCRIKREAYSHDGILLRISKTSISPCSPSLFDAKICKAFSHSILVGSGVPRTASLTIPTEYVDATMLLSFRSFSCFEQARPLPPSVLAELDNWVQRDIDDTESMLSKDLVKVEKCWKEGSFEGTGHLSWLPCSASGSLM